MLAVSKSIREDKEYAGWSDSCGRQRIFDMVFVCLTSVCTIYTISCSEIVPAAEISSIKSTFNSKNRRQEHQEAIIVLLTLGECGKIEVRDIVAVVYFELCG